MRATTLLATAAIVLLGGVAGCQGCLSIEDYTLVPGPPPDAGTGGSSSSSTNVGGSGGDPCLAPGNAAGTVVVSSIVPPGGLGTNDECTLAAGPAGSIDVLALDPGNGNCFARGRIVPSVGVELESAPRIHHRTDELAVVGATFRGGSLELPQQCDVASIVVIEPPEEATDALFVAGLRAAGSAFCTAWAHWAWTTDAGAAGSLRVHAIDMGPDGTVGVAGALGGATTHFDHAPESDVVGGAFFARWSVDGTLGGLATLEGPPGVGAALGVTARPGSFALTGSLQHETPACHTCTGETNVLEAANACPGGVGGAGGAGGGGGGGGAGGQASGGGASGGTGTGGAAPDGTNAFIWLPPGITGGACTHLTTYGSDRYGASDTQIGFDLDYAKAGCSAYWTGAAGLDAWRFIGDMPASALFDAGGVTRDGFVARFDGGDAIGCGTDAVPWNLRMTPSGSAASVWGERVSALKCSDGATVLAGARGGATTLDLHRCTAAACDPMATSAALPSGADAQLLLMGLDGTGQLLWHGAFGPVRPGPDAGEGTFEGRAHHDLTSDGRDWLYVVFTTTGPLRATSLEPFGCDELVPDAPAGTWIVSLQPGGFSGGAMCVWAHRLGS